MDGVDCRVYVEERNKKKNKKWVQGLSYEWRGRGKWNEMKIAVGGIYWDFRVKKKKKDVRDYSRLQKSHQKEGIRLEEPSGEESRGAEASGGGGGGFQIIGLKQNDWDKTVS